MRATHHHRSLAAEERGWFVLIHQADGDSRAEYSAMEGEFHRRVDGLVVSLQSLDAQDVARRRSTISLVALGNRSPGPDVPHVGIDNIVAGKLAMYGPRLPTDCQDRLGHDAAQPTKGLFNGLLDAGLPLLTELMRPITDNSGEEGERAAKELLDEVGEPPDGLFAVTDWVVFGAISTLDQHGLRVPEDVCVVGYENIPYSLSFNSSLTTIAPDREAIASRAVDLLAEQIDSGSKSMPGQEQVGIELIARESTRRWLGQDEQVRCVRPAPSSSRSSPPRDQISPSSV